MTTADHGAEFDRIHQEALREGRRMSLPLRITTCVLAAICLAGAATIWWIEPLVLPAEGQILVAVMAVCLFVTAVNLFWVAATVPSPSKTVASSA